MTNLINPKPRFGFNPDIKTIYDYVLQRDVPVASEYTSTDGVWNLMKVRDLILEGQPIEAARISIAAPKAAAKPTGSPALPTGHPAVAMHELAFTPIQVAALGLTPAQVSNGLSDADVKNIGMTPARAIALKLSPAQSAFLMPKKS
jgi:hypothetical protein